MRVFNAAKMQALRRVVASGVRLGPRSAAIAAAGVAATAAAAGTASLDAPPSALSPTEFRAFKVQKIEHLSPNTALYRCALPVRSLRAKTNRLIS